MHIIAGNIYLVLGFCASQIQHYFMSNKRLNALKTKHPKVANSGSIMSEYFNIFYMASRDLINWTTWNRNFRSLLIYSKTRTFNLKNCCFTFFISHFILPIINFLMAVFSETKGKRKSCLRKFVAKTITGNLPLVQKQTNYAISTTPIPHIELNLQ